MENRDKYIQETKSFRNIDDGFRKIIFTNDEVLSNYTEDGYTIINIEDFLLDPSLLEA
jgi:predicted AAA+ superfamily ATPase